MNKIIEGAKEAVKVAQCDHVLRALPPDTKNPKMFGKFRCAVCEAIFYIPK